MAYHTMNCVALRGRTWRAAAWHLTTDGPCAASRGGTRAPSTASGIARSSGCRGIPEESFTGRPVIGILNSWSEVAGCNAHLRDLAEHVKRGVLRAGGFPVEVPVISLGEPIIKPTAMLYRNLMAMAVEELIRGNPARRRRPPRELRQDHPGQPDGRGERRRPGADGHRRPDAQRPLPQRARRRVHGLLATPRRAPGRPDHARPTGTSSRPGCAAATGTARRWAPRRRWPA